jgi:hypothetical protein
MESNSQRTVPLSSITKTLDDTKSDPLSPELINKLQKDGYLRSDRHLARLEQKNVDNLTNAQIEAMSESQIKTLSRMMSPAQKALIQKAPYGINTDGSFTTQAQIDAITKAQNDAYNKETKRINMYVLIGVLGFMSLPILYLVGVGFYNTRESNKMMVSRSSSGFGRKISRFGNDLRKLR